MQRILHWFTVFLMYLPLWFCFRLRRVWEKLAYLTIPKTEDEKKTADDVFVILDDRFLSSPAFAIEQCRSLVSQMAEMTRDGFLEAMDVLGEYSEEKAQDVIDKENRSMSMTTRSPHI